MYFVTFFPGQFNQMSFYSIKYRQDEFQVRENSTWVTDFLSKLLVFDFIFVPLCCVKPHNEMEIGTSVLLLLAASNLGFWISETNCFTRASCSHVGQAPHNSREHYLHTPPCEGQSLELRSVHFAQLYTLLSFSIVKEVFASCIVSKECRK